MGAFPRVVCESFARRESVGVRSSANPAGTLTPQLISLSIWRPASSGALQMGGAAHQQHGSRAELSTSAGQMPSPSTPAAAGGALLL